MSDDDGVTGEFDEAFRRALEEREQERRTNPEAYARRRAERRRIRAELAQTILKAAGRVGPTTPDGFYRAVNGLGSPSGDQLTCDVSELIAASRFPFDGKCIARELALLRKAADDIANGLSVVRETESVEDARQPLEHAQAVLDRRIAVLARWQSDIPNRPGPSPDMPARMVALSAARIYHEWTGREAHARTYPGARHEEDASPAGEGFPQFLEDIFASLGITANWVAPARYAARHWRDYWGSSGQTN